MDRMQYLLPNRAEVHHRGNQAMRCNHCNHTMNKTEEIVELKTRQTWYECPVCETVHTVSERSNDQHGHRIGHVQRFSAAAPGNHDY